MNLQEEKMELVRLAKENSPDMSAFYDGFRESVREVKESQDGKTQLKDAKEWLDEL